MEIYYYFRRRHFDSLYLRRPVRKDEICAPAPANGSQAMPETIFSCLALFAFIFAVLSIVNAFAAAFVSGLYALAAAVVAGVIGCFLRRMITY